MSINSKKSLNFGFPDCLLSLKKNQPAHKYVLLVCNELYIMYLVKNHCYLLLPFSIQVHHELDGCTKSGEKKIT